MSYGKTLRETRENRGISQDELAKRVCITKRMLGMIEADKVYPSYSLMLLISCTLNGGIR